MILSMFQMVNTPLNMIECLLDIVVNSIYQSALFDNKFVQMFVYAGKLIDRLY